MSGLLVQRFLEKYPPFGVNKSDQVVTYPPYDDSFRGIEDIFLTFKNRSFVGLRKPLITIEEIKQLATKIFDDVPYTFYEEDYIIDFTPEDYNDKYIYSYHRQHIAFLQSPLSLNTIEFSTGHSGSFELHERQREKYFQFANEVYEIFIKNASALEKDNRIN